MERLELRSMIFLEAKRDSWKALFPAAALQDAVCLLADDGTICAAGIGVG
jgi:hypothetical protein